MATRYVWRKQDLNYSESTSAAQRVYVGDQDIYAGSGYTFDSTSGLYTLQNPEKINVKNLQNKSKYKYFIVGGSSGETVYDNSSHTLPESTTSTVSDSYYGGISDWWLWGWNF